MPATQPDLPECLEASEVGQRLAPTGPMRGMVGGSPEDPEAVSVAGMAGASTAGIAAVRVGAGAGMVVAAAGMRHEGAVASVAGTATGIEKIDYRRASHVRLGSCRRCRSGSLAFSHRRARPVGADDPAPRTRDSCPACGLAGDRTTGIARTFRRHTGRG